MKFVDEYDIKGKKVILRCDYNVPIENGVVLDESRIVKSLKTIYYLLENDCSIIIMSHLGRIKVNDDKRKYSLKPVADYLSTLLTKEVRFVSNPVGMDVLKATKDMKSGDIVMLENTRYCDFPEKLESTNNDGLAKYWSSLGEVFVCDAFGAMHRVHTSVAGISKHIPTCLGLLVKEELQNLNKVVNDVEKPYAVFMGGAKVDDKIKYIKKILPICDYLLIGGGIANSFLYAIGYDIGDSLSTSDELTLEELQQLYEEYKDKIIMPIDFVIDNGKIFDLGEKSIEKYIKYLSQAKTIFINGTCGMFEEEEYSEGTKKLFAALKRIDAYKIAGGGDTLNAIKKFNLADAFDYLSSGGGAALEYISSGQLLSLDYIMENQNK